MPIKRNLILLLCVLAFAARLAAQQAPRLRNFQPQDYEAQNQNWSLIQSPEGWLFAGNNSGLLTFDGARWQLYELPEKQAVRAIATGRNGEIFCGGFAEFGFWAKDASGRLSYTSLSAQLGAAQASKEEIWHILVLPDFVLFQSFSTIYKYNYQKISVLKPPGAIMFAQWVNGKVVLPVIGKGLYELSADNTFHALPGTEVLSDKIVQFIVPGGRDEMWAGTSNDGIFEIFDGKCRPWSNPQNEILRKKQLNKAVALKNGGWALGTILDGVYILDSVAHLSCHLHRENGLQNNTVLAMLEDRDGNLWLGLDRGIDCAVLRSPLSFFIDQTGKVGTVYTAAASQGLLYLGTNQGVFCAPYPSEVSVPFSLIEGTQGQVWQLKVFDNQLICGHNSGTFVIRGRVAERISEVTGGWCALEAPGMSGVLLQSTYTGLVLYRKTPGGSWAQSDRVTGFDEPLREIAFDAAGNLWGVHPNKGLYRLRLSEDLKKVQAYKYYTRDDGLQADLQLGLSSMPDHQLIVNAKPLAMRISEEGTDTRFEPLAMRKWLPGAGNEYFAIDSSGLKYYPEKGNPVKIPLNLVPNYENVEPLSTGDYLFCLENGFALLGRRTLGSLQNRSAPAVVIKQVRDASGLSYWPLADLRIPFHSNSLEFQFAQPFYEHPVRFSWWLEGFSKTWSAWSYTVEKEFTNLPPGAYTFRVRSEAGGEEAALHFHILPPWYRSVWAFLVYTLFFGIVFWLLEIYNQRRLERQRLRLESEKEKEILLLEVENKNRELSNAAFNLIRKNEALQHLKDNLLESKSEPKSLNRIIRDIDAHLEGDHDWEIFEESFNRVHDDFFKRLMQHYPDLTPGDLRLAAYLKMNLSSKEIAPLLNISVRGVENKRYRLRKKLGLPEEANLTEFIMAF